MPKPKIPNQRKANLEHKKRTERYAQLIQQIYDRVAQEAARHAAIAGIDPDKQFSFADYPTAMEAMRKLQAQMLTEVSATIMCGTSEEWKESNLVQDLVAKKVLTAYTGTSKHGEEYTRYFQTNPDALTAFQQRKDRGMNLSTRVWKLSEQYKAELEESITASIAPGISAMELASQVKKYLKEPDKRFRRIKEKQEDGNFKWKLSKNAQTYHPGHGVYRSSARNAQRLARTEINMAYRTAEQTRWKQFDFVVGYEVKTTQNGRHIPDICDELAGKYPKDFVFTGWHPQCYSDDSEVLTNQGWKLFKDVADDDLILSLNPDTRETEWVGIVDRQCDDRNGEMIRFHNKSLDCLVTPEHRMVYLNKSDGSIRYCRADEYTNGKGAFYRGAEYIASDKEYFAFEDRNVAFDDFCEFMGYYLSDGSLQHGTGVIIAQRYDQPAFDSIIAVAERMGYSPKICKETIAIYNSALNRYLSRFGRCTDKFIPDEINTSSKRQISIFLNAFIKCDGHCRKPKSFIGNHGNAFRSDKEERVYFTTSERLAGDLSELILKIGHRPSFYVSEPGIACKKDGSIIKSNYRCYRISECYSTTATVFKKEVIPYSGKVYDLTLERNHIMYIRRNGKCFWGSNCMCYTIPILKTEEEFWADDSEDSTASVNEVTEPPQGFKDWIADNQERIERAEERETLPYFIKDNRGVVNDVLYPREEYSDIQISSENNRLPLPKLSKDFSEGELQNYIRTLVKNEGWLNHSDKEVEVIFFSDASRADASANREDFRISIRPKDAMFRALYKVSNGIELSYEECNSLGTLWHEINHLRHIGIDKAGVGGPYAGKMYKDIYIANSSMELANEWVSRNTLPEFFKALGLKEMPFPELMQSRHTGYNKMVQLYNHLVVNKFHLDKSAVLESVKDGLFNRPYNNQIAVLMDGLKAGGLSVSKDSQLEKIIKEICVYGKEPSPDKINELVDKMKYSIDTQYRGNIFAKTLNNVQSVLISRQFNGIETYEELSSKASSLLSKAVGNPVDIKINPELMPIETAKAHLSELISIARDYEFKQGKLSEIILGYKPIDKLEQGVTSYIPSSKSKTIKLTKVIENRDSKVAIHNSRCDKSRLPFSLTSHEGGHLLFSYNAPCSKELIFLKTEIRDIWDSYQFEFNTLIKSGQFEEAAKILIGQYGHNDAGEFMAECFQEYRNSSNPSKYARKIGKLLDQYFKK